MTTPQQLGLSLRRTTRPGARQYVRVPDVPEDDLHASVAKMLDTVLDPVCTFWTTCPAGGYELRPQAAARLARLGYKSGTPDVLIWWAIGVDDVGAGGIELKTGNGRLSKTRVVRGKRGPRVVIGQEDIHLRMRAAGVRLAVCRSLDAVLGVLREWTVPMRART